jgi:hypothetical protein
VAASWLGQSDPRISAVVALDNLCTPHAPSSDEGVAFAAPNPDYGGQPTALHALPTECFGSPFSSIPRLRKPALGISSDNLAFPTLTPTPYLAPPNPWAKARASLAYSVAGVDTGEVVIRGGTHLDFTDAPGMLPATYRGVDVSAWYTTAWFLRYVAHRPIGQAMLLTRRWQNDTIAQAYDPEHDPNVMSWHFRSRLSIHRLDGGSWLCNDLRRGCAGMTSASTDGVVGPFSWYRYAE